VKVLRFFALIILSASWIYSFPQSDSTSSPLQFLLRSKATVPCVGWENGYQYVEVKDKGMTNSLQILVKNNKGLFVFLNGTGRIYQANLKDGVPQFTRLDSTVYFGYNVGSFPFSYNDSIYSLGGYGYWRVNGQLRVFVDQAHQWDIVKLNEEIPILFDGRIGLIWYDFAAKKIYIGNSFVRNEAVRTDSMDEGRDVYIVAVLDLVKKQWQHKGKLSNYLVQRAAQIRNMASAPWGQLIQFGNKITLLDYVHNELLSLNTEKSDFLMHMLSRNQEPPNYSYFFRDSTLYWGSTAHNVLDSFHLSRNDFMSSSIAVYVPEGVSVPHPFWEQRWVYIVEAIVLLLAVVGLLRLRSSRIKTPTNTQNENFSIVPVKPLFDGKEMTVIKLLVANSSKGRSVSIEALNIVMGISKRNAEIQKKQRSEVIQSINSKYSIISKKNEPLITKSRSEFDKRAFEYYINVHAVKQMEEIVKME
jgi:hypothetical protein